MANAPISQTIFLTEDGSTLTAQPAIVIPPLVPVTLGTLALSATPKVGTPSTGSISGATTGSTITDTIAGLTVDSVSRTWTWDGTGRAGSFANGLIESHPAATNNNRASPVTIAAAGPVATIVYGLSFDGPAGPPPNPDPDPVQDFAIEAAAAQPAEGGSAPAPVQNFAIEAAAAPPAEGSAPVQDFAIEAASNPPQEA
jgi:hypothetical protein